MNSPSSPENRGFGHAPHPAAEAAWFVSAHTRQWAQEADVGMTRDEWQYTPTSFKSILLPVAASKHLLP